MNPVASCPICFENLSDKIKASPDNCEHIFCLPCLEKWSKLGSYCPVDRKRFKKILNLSTDTLIQVKSHKRKRKRIVYDFTAHCEICSSTTDSNVMLLCDCCDLGYHIHCLKPPLKEIPAGLWFCPTCISVEEKLKKKNGITKEVEAELGGFSDKLLYKTKCREKVNEKKSMVKAKEFDNSVPVKNANFQTCYDIISNFEDMIVRKKHCEDAGSSSYLDNTVNKIDKIYKSFDISSKNSRVEHSKHLKTYSVRKAYKKAKIIKSFDVEQGKKSYPESNSINTDDTCLSQNSMSSDINLQNHTLSVSHEFLNVDTLYDDVDDDHSLNRKDIEQVNSNIVDDIQVEMYSETSGILSDEFLENSPQRKNQNGNSSMVQVFEDMNSFGSESMTVFDINVEKSATGKSHEKMHAIDKVLELTAERDSFKNMPALERNVKLNTIRKSFEKMPVLEKNLRKEAEKSPTIKQKTFNRTVIASNAEVSIPSGSCVWKMSSKGTSKNLIPFSIFQRIEGIDASQKICSQVSAIDVPFSSNIRLQKCSACNDEFFAKSEMHCKLCSLKHFNTKESERFFNNLKAFKKELGYKNIKTNKVKFGGRMLGTQQNLMNNSSNVIERRKRSLIRILKKIHNSKCINIIPIN